MEKISQLMDGDLDAYEADALLKRLKSDASLRESWQVYHLVGDALRQEHGLTGRIAARVSERLEQEPTVMGPRFTASRRVVRYAMSAAAGAAGLAVVAWLALGGLPVNVTSQQLAGTPDAAAVAQQAMVESVTAQSTALAAETDAVDEYLLAHRSVSDFRTMQGTPPYVRPVASE